MRHPDLSAARANRDYVLGQVTDAVNNISEVAKATGPSHGHDYEGSGGLAKALEEFEVMTIMNVKSFTNFNEKLITADTIGLFHCY